MKTSLFILLFSLGLFVSCKKKTYTPPPLITYEPDTSCDQTIETFSNDTIHPSDYIMTYPGSWWEYQDGTTFNCTDWESVAYKSVVNINGCTKTTIDHHFLPYSTQFGFIAFDQMVYNEVSQPNTAFINIIGNFNDSIIPTITIQGQVYNDLILTISPYYIDGPFGITLVWTHYALFAKDVGLVQSYKIQSNGTQFSLRELTDYYIAPH